MMFGLGNFSVRKQNSVENTIKSAKFLWKMQPNRQSSYEKRKYYDILMLVQHEIQLQEELTCTVRRLKN